MTLRVAALETTDCAVELHGPGRVGQALLRRLHGEGIVVAQIRNSRGVQQSNSIDAKRRVLVDATPPREGLRGEAHVALLEDALHAGTDVVTCNKAPLAQAWERLQQAALRGQATLAVSATVGAGTPVLATLRRLQEAHGIKRIEASLSGTLSFLLQQVKAGTNLAAAVQGAQAAGYCEPDPSRDLDGRDALDKAVIIHNLLWGRAPAVKVRLELGEAAIRALGQPAVVAHVERGSIALRLQEWDAVAPRHVKVRAVLLDGATVELGGPGAGVDATGGALLADVAAIRNRRAAAGIYP